MLKAFTMCLEIFTKGFATSQRRAPELFFCLVIFVGFLRLYLFAFRQRGREGEIRKHQCVVASHAPPSRDLACNPGMCPDWESNLGPFALQAAAQSTEPHQPGLNLIFQ